MDKKKGDHAPPWPPLLYLARPMKNRARLSIEANVRFTSWRMLPLSIIRGTKAGCGTKIEEAPHPKDTPNMPLGTGTGSGLSESRYRYRVLVRSCLFCWCKNTI